jgi:hypothetical protein
MKGCRESIAEFSGVRPFLGRLSGHRLLRLSLEPGPQGREIFPARGERDPRSCGVRDARLSPDRCQSAPGFRRCEGEDQGVLSRGPEPDHGLSRSRGFRQRTAEAPFLWGIGSEALPALTFHQAFQKRHWGWVCLLPGFQCTFPGFAFGQGPKDQGTQEEDRPTDTTCGCWRSSRS